MINNLRRLQPEAVERYLQMRSPEGTECARQLQNIYPALSLSTCKNRIYDSINYFNSDCTVTQESWNLFFADQMMQLRDINISAHDFREARICMEKARDYRIAASSTIVDPNLIKFKEQLISPDVKKERMRISETSIMEQYRRALSIIENRDIPASEKDRLKTELELELNIENADYEDTEN